MSEELKPCPFCGGEAHVYLAGNGPAELSAWRYNIECDHLPECPISTSGDVVGDLDACSDDLDKLTEAWNRRAERTCRPEVCDDGAGAWGVYCSECGYRFAGPYGKREVPEHMATRRDIMPRYCPSCGARVEVGE